MSIRIILAELSKNEVKTSEKFKIYVSAKTIQEEPVAKRLPYTTNRNNGGIK